MGGAVDATRKTARIVHVAGDGGPTLPVRDGEPVESFEPEGTVVVFSGADWLPADVSLEGPNEFGYTQQFDERLAGTTAVTVGAFSTPKAEEFGHTLNPVAKLSAADLVTSDRGRTLLAESGVLDEAGIGDAEHLGVAPAGTTPVRVLGADASAESFAGVVRDGAALRLVLVHVLRREADGDVVFVAGVQHRPLWSAPDNESFGSEHVDEVASSLGDADLGPLLLEGDESLVTDAGVQASVDEVVAVAPALERISES